MQHLDLHQDALIIDSHNDTIVAHARRGGLSLSGGQPHRDRWPSLIAFLQGHEDDQAAPPIQINLPLMRAGGIDTGFFAIDVTRARGAHLAYAMDGFGFFLHDLQTTQHPHRIIRRAQDIHDAKRDGVPGLLLAVEHADATERSLNVLRALYELGVRSIGLTHNVSSAAADGNAEAREGVGLTDYGRELVWEMNRLGMVVDLAHVSPSAFYDSLQVSTRPIIFSHGNARALCDHPRNLTNDQLRALADHGGVIGLSFVPFFVDALAPSLERFLDHIDHVVNVAGIQTVGLGSDFDGGGTLLPGAADLPSVTEGLLRRGYSEDDVRLFLGGNTLRLLTDALG